MKNNLSILLLCFILLLGGGLRIYKINNPIGDWHSWRQVDTASVTKFLLKDGEILVPKYFDISNVQTGFENPKGYRFVEFPVFNVLHVILSKLPFSFEASGRLVSIFASLITAIFLYLIGNQIQGKRLGLLTAFFYLTLPFNVYFTRVILPDPLAVTFSTASLYFFIVFIERNSKKSLFISSILMSLALLTKPQSVFFTLPMIYLSAKKFGFRNMFNKTSLLVYIDIALIPLIMWRGWLNYNDHFVGVPHFMWLLNGNNIRFKPSFWRWIFGERLGKLILGYWGLIPFGVGIFSRKTHVLVTCILISSFIYLSVFASANVMHDYYQIFIMPAISFSLASGFIFMNQSIFSKKYISLPFSLLVLFVMYSSSYFYVRENYKINDYRAINSGIFADRTLPQDAKVIAPYNGDTMFLYHINRQGWPVVTTDIDTMISMGANYYVSTNFSDPDTQNFKQRFETLEENDQFIILNLSREK